MSDINDITIDFAYLQLNKLVGQGATSKVVAIDLPSIPVGI
jgi:hypothetical protein